MTTQQITSREPLPKGDEVDLGRVYYTLLDGKWLIIAITLLATLLGAAYALLVAPEYKANALIQVEEKSSGMGLLGKVEELNLQSSTASAEIEIVTSRKVLGAAINEVKRDIIVTPRYFPLIGQFMARHHQGEQLADPPFFSRYAWGGEQIQVTQLKVPDYLLDQPLRLQVIEQGFLLFNKQGAQLLKGQVGQLAEQNGISMLVTDLKARPNTEFTLVKASESQATNALKQALTVHEKAKSGILALDLVGTNPVDIERTLGAISQQYLLQNIQRQSAEAEKSLEFLTAQQPELKAKLDRAEERLNNYRQQNKSVDLAIETQSVLTQLVDLEKQLNELSFAEAELSRLYTRAHPSYQALLEKKQSLLQERNELSGKVEHLPNTQQEILRLTRDVEVSQEIYIQLLNKVQELNIVKAGTVGNVRIIDEAVTAPSPVKPHKPLIVLLSALLGATLGLALVLLRSFLNRGIDDPEEFERVGLHVYASVPLSKAQQKLSSANNRNSASNIGSLLLAENEPTDLVVESLRALRTSLHFAMLKARNNIIAIGGPSLGIGKTFISANLAAICAQAGQKVLVIDADLRKGYMHNLFQVPAQEGLSDVLKGEVPLAQVIHATNINNLHFISRGQLAHNSSELLMHSDFKQLLEQARQQYDLVIIDTPPILSVTDGAIISSHAGLTLLVSRFAKTSIKEVEVAMRRYEQNGTTVKGMIFNAVEPNASMKRYSNYEYYGEV